MDSIKPKFFEVFRLSMIAMVFLVSAMQSIILVFLFLRQIKCSCIHSKTIKVAFPKKLNRNFIIYFQLKFNYSTFTKKNYYIRYRREVSYPFLPFPLYLVKCRNILHVFLSYFFHFMTRKMVNW